jgi:glycosyltransferase involved in cell wall biosynthesis
MGAFCQPMEKNESSRDSEGMKLLIIFPSTFRGGAEKYALTLAQAAVKKGWDVCVGFPKTEETISLIEDFQKIQVGYHALQIADTGIRELKKIDKYLPHLARTLALLIKTKPDVVQIILPYPDRCLGSIIACALLKIPTVVRFALVPVKFSITPTISKVYAWAKKRNQQWIAISENNRQLISNYFQIPKEEILRIYNGTKVESNYLNLSEQEIADLRSQVRQELGLAQTSQILLTVGRLSTQKGYQDIIPIATSIINEFPNVKFIWVGDGEEQENLLEKVRKIGIEEQVLFLGYRSDVPRLLKAADIFLFPTYYEGGQSFALAEAMVYGVPIVSSNASGIPEIIEDKIHGLLFQVGDRDRLRESLLWALKNLESMQEMARNAEQHASNFSQQKMIQAYFDVWHKLAKSKA